MNELNKSI